MTDKLGRKTIISIGKLAFLMAIIIFALYPSFIGFLIMALALGIHEAFISGAQEALLYDNLKDYQKEKLFGKVLAFTTSLRGIGLGTGVLVAGLVTQISISYNLIGSVIIAVLGSLASFWLTESKSQSNFERVYFLDHLKLAVKNVWKKPHLRDLVVFGMAVITAYVIISEYFTVALKHLGLSYVLIGFLAAAEALFLYLVHTFLKNLKNRFKMLLSCVGSFDGGFYAGGNSWGRSFSDCRFSSFASG